MEALSVVLDMSCPSVHCTVSGLHVARSVQRYFLAFVNGQCITRLVRKEAMNAFEECPPCHCRSHFHVGPAAVCEAVLTTCSCCSHFDPLQHSVYI
jgi:hypothetical protein